MLTAITFFIILLILVLIHEFGHFFAAKRLGVKVEEFGFGFPPRIFGKKIGETLYSFNIIPLGGFVKLFGEEYHEAKKAEKKAKFDDKDSKRAFINKKPWQKTIIIIGGVVMNFVLGWVITSYLFTVGVPTPNGVVIEEVQKNSPAMEKGIKKGDQIIKLTSKSGPTEILTTYDLTQKTSEFAGQEINLLIQGENKQHEISIIPRQNPPKGEGSLGVVISQKVINVKYPWYTAGFHGFVDAGRKTLFIASQILKLPAQLFVSKKQDLSFTGPVGIAKIVGDARQYGVNALLELTALLSLNLAVINILPFPALDGGRLVFIIYEWITGKRSNAKLEQYLNLGGIIVLLTLSLVITYFDIKKFW